MRTNKVNPNDRNIYQKYNDIQKTKKKDNERKRKYNAIKRKESLSLIIIVLLIIGALNLYSANMRLESIRPKIIAYSTTTFLSIIVFFITKKIDYKKYNNENIRRGLFIGAALLFSVMIINLPIFPKVNGGKGWINFMVLPFRIQVTELFKLGYIIIIARIFSRIKDKEKFNEDLGFENLTYRKTFWGSVFVFGLFFVLLSFGLNDLGTAIHYGMIFAFMVFMSDLGDRFIAYLTSGVFLAMFFGISHMYYFGAEGYKKQRLISFINGFFNNEYDLDVGYQVFQSVIGYGSGGIFGKGYGNGIQKYSYLPEIDTDFAVVTIAEEWGFIGMIILLILYAIMFLIICSVAKEVKDYFGKYLVIGIAGYIITQVIINISVTLGLLPVFGIPLPFISYGGSSMMTLLAALGIVYNVNKKTI